MNSSFRKKAFSGLSWSAASQAGRQALQFVTSIMLAWILAPSDFGLLSMALVVTGFAALFKDLGTSSAIIQRTDVSESLLSSIFWMNTAFGFLITIAVYLLSPLAAVFYNESRVTEVLQVLSVNFAVSGLSILHQGILQKQLFFKKIALIELSSTFIGSVVGIAAALNGSGVWSLVYQYLVIAVSGTVFLWLATPWRPSLVFRWAEIKGITGYSLNLTGFNVFNYFSRNADSVIIGRFLGAQDLGYYTLAYRIMLFPIQNISSVLGRVLFPLYAPFQNDNLKLRDAFLKYSYAVAFITFPLMLGLFALAEPFTAAVFGPRWQPVSTLLMILAPLGMLQSVSSLVGLIYQLKDRTDVMLIWGIVSGLILAAFFIVAVRWGINGVALSYAAAMAILIYPCFAVPFRFIDLRFTKLLSMLQRPFLISLLMMAVLYVLKEALSSYIPTWSILAVLVPFGAVFYLGACWMFNREQTLGMLSALRPRA